MESEANSKETVVISKAEYESMKQQIAWLMEQLKLSKHRQFGVSSEKSEYDQLSLFNEAEVEADDNIADPNLVEIKKHYRKRTRLTTDKLPEDLPVEIIEHSLPGEQICPDCGSQLRVIGNETREELVLIPAAAKIRRHVSATYACRHCETHSDHVPIVKAALPKPVIRGGFASPEAIAHIAVQKFTMGSPLYRQEQEWFRNGILLSRQTMSNWLLKAADDWLKPIYSRLHELICAGEVAHADETTLQVLHESGKTPQSKSYMWLYRTSGDAKHPIVLYDYQPSRRASHPEAFLKNFKGFLHTDGYDGYHKLPKQITVVGCWAHVRRKFDEALKIIPEKDRLGTKSLHGKHFCDRLFALEREFAELPADDYFKARYKARMDKSKSVMDEFFAWASHLGALPKTPLGKAVQYAIDQKIWLEHVLLDGRLELSNNRAERSIKPFVIGRKNWLFANTAGGATASAIFYSLIETAKENGINPYEYLTFVFNAAPNMDADTPVDELMPWNLECR